MRETKVKDVKKILEEALNTLESFNDGDVVNMQSNTYFVNKSQNFLGTRSGYLALDRFLLEDSIQPVEWGWGDEEDDDDGTVDTFLDVLKKS
jgi:hypothetical protein